MLPAPWADARRSASSTWSEVLSKVAEDGGDPATLEADYREQGFIGHALVIEGGDPGGLRRDRSATAADQRPRSLAGRSRLPCVGGATRRACADDRPDLGSGRRRCRSPANPLIDPVDGDYSVDPNPARRVLNGRHSVGGREHDGAYSPASCSYLIASAQDSRKVPIRSTTSFRFRRLMCCISWGRDCSPLVVVE